MYLSHTGWLGPRPQFLCWSLSLWYAQYMTVRVPRTHINEEFSSVFESGLLVGSLKQIPLPKPVDTMGKEGEILSVLEALLR